MNILVCSHSVFLLLDISMGNMGFWVCVALFLLHFFVIYSFLIRGRSFVRAWIVFTFWWGAILLKKRVFN